jgi:hypothetical protein
MSVKLLNKALELTPKRDNLTYDRCKEVSLEHTTIVSLQRSNKSVYVKIRQNNWLELLSHMTRLNKPAGYYTYDKCKEIISGMKYLSELQGTSLLGVIRKHGWYDELSKDLIRKQHAPYTEEEVLTKVLEFKSRSEFQKKCPGYYNAMCRLGITERAYQHMGKSKTIKQYTKDEILKSARKYTNQRDWLNNEPSIFNCACGYNKKHRSQESKLFWVECIKHMEYIFKPNGYWTYERCKVEALKYNTYKEFRENNSPVYYVIQKNGWWDELCPHMLKEKFTWKDVEDPYEYCKKIALTFTDRSNIPKEFTYVDTKIRNEKWYELYDHIPHKSTNFKRYIYAFEFEDKSVYIGLTYNPNKRYSDHFTGNNSTRSAVKHHNEVNGVNFKFKILTTEPVHKDLAGKLEEDTIELYKNGGWSILNRAKAGALGGNQRKWTYESCKNIAL